MNISHKPMILCFVFTVLGSTLSVARPIMHSEDGCRLHQMKTAACHVPMLEPCAVTGHTRCRFPNAPKDDWPANMILGNADPLLVLRRRETDNGA
jgi:hypothetical protein